MQIYGILASPAGHSLSPAMHNVAFKNLGIDAYYYAFDIAENELDDFMTGLNDGGVCGLSVSLPYKEKIITYLDEIDEDSKAIGAVNTIKNVDGKLYGYNTDWQGALKALELGDLTNLLGKKCVVLGAGGACRAIVYGLKKMGAEVWILNRDVEKAQMLAQEFDCSFGALTDFAQIEAEVVVQTTSAWLSEPDAQLVPKEALKPNMIVMDIVYKPLLTPLLKDAQEQGCKIITGEKMLLLQAEEQFKIWTGKDAPLQPMAQILAQKLQTMK